MSQNLSSAAAMIGALSVKVSNSLDPDETKSNLIKAQNVCEDCQQTTIFMVIFYNSLVKFHGKKVWEPQHDLNII